MLNITPIRLNVLVINKCIPYRVFVYKITQQIILLKVDL